MRALAFVAAPACAALLFAAQSNAAAGTYVQDGAHMLKPETVAAIEARDAQLQERSGKAVTVVTVMTTGGLPIETVAAGEARELRLNGALIYVARADRQLSISYGANTAMLFPPALQTSIKQALRSSFRQGDYDNGMITAVDAISGVIVGGASGGHGPALPPVQTSQPAPTGIFGIGWLWWVVIAIVVIFIVRVMFRRPSGSPMGSSGAAPPGTSGSGVSTPQSGGSGSFIPSLLGGAAGAYIGSELADRNRGDAATPLAGAEQANPESASPDAGQGFSDSGGSGDFSGSDSAGGDTGGDSGGGW